MKSKFIDEAEMPEMENEASSIDTAISAIATCLMIANTDIEERSLNVFKKLLLEAKKNGDIKKAKDAGTKAIDYVHGMYNKRANEVELLTKSMRDLVIR